MVGLVHTTIVEIGAYLAEHVFIAGFFKVSHHNAFGVGFGIIAGLAQQFGGPKPQKLVATGFSFELQLLVMGKLVFECVFAVFHIAHELAPGGESIIPYMGVRPIKQKTAESAMQTRLKPRNSGDIGDNSVVKAWTIR